MDIAKHGKVSDDILQQIKHLRLERGYELDMELC